MSDKPRTVCPNCVHCPGPGGGHINVRGDKAQPHIALVQCHSLTASGSRTAVAMVRGISFVEWEAAEGCDEFQLKTLVPKVTP